MPIVQDSTPPVGNYSFLKQPRVLTSSLSYVDLSTLEGVRYEVYFDKVFATGETQYILYQFPPASSGVLVGLSNRTFKSLNGEAEISILWDTAGMVLGDSLTLFNANRNLNMPALTEVNVLTGVPTTEGIVRETDFLTGGGSGSNSSGSISPSLGLRLYSADSFFVAKVTNLHSQTNRIHLEYSLLEIPSISFNI